MKEKIRRRRPRCKQVLAVLNNRLETVPLLREETHAQTGGDFEVGPLEVAVVRYAGTEVSVPLHSVVFLHGHAEGFCLAKHVDPQLLGRPLNLSRAKIPKGH